MIFMQQILSLCTTNLYYSYPNGDCLQIRYIATCQKYQPTIISGGNIINMCMPACVAPLLDDNDICTKTCTQYHFVDMVNNVCVLECPVYWSRIQFNDATQQVCSPSCSQAINIMATGYAKECVACTNADTQVITISYQKYCRIAGKLLELKNNAFRYPDEINYVCLATMHSLLCIDVACRDAKSIFGPSYTLLVLQQPSGYCVTGCGMEYVQSTLSDDVCTACTTNGWYRFINSKCSSTRDSLQCPKYKTILTGVNQCYKNEDCPLSYQDVCVDSCPDAAPFNNAGVCDGICPTAWTMVNNIKTCQNSCATNYFVSTLDLQCQLLCSSQIQFYINTVLYCSHCVNGIVAWPFRACLANAAACTSPKKILNNYLCVSATCDQAPQYFPGTKALYEFQGACVACTAPTQYLDSGQCVVKCSSSYYYDSLSTKNCTFCTGQEYRQLNGVCSAQPDTVQCPNFIPVSTYSICVLVCEVDYYSFNRQCLKQCPYMSPYVTSASNPVCAASCASRIYYNLKNVLICTDSCSDYLLVSSNTHNECLGTCTVPLMTSGKNYCQKKCTPGINCTDPTKSLKTCSGYVSGSDCASSCKYGNYAGACLPYPGSSCDPGYVVDSSTLGCTKLAANQYFQRLATGQKVLMASCPGVIMGRECITYLCPSGQAWIAGGCYAVDKCQGAVEGGICYTNNAKDPSWSGV